MLTLESFEQAAEIVKQVTQETKLIKSSYFSDLTGNKVFLKPENMQRTGAYKVRGAYYKISTLTEEEKAKAREAIENDRLKMVDSVKKEMVNVAMDAAEKLIGSKNGEELDRKAIQDFVKEADSHEE